MANECNADYVNKLNTSARCAYATSYCGDNSSYVNPYIFYYCQLDGSLLYGNLIAVFNRTNDAP